MRMRFAIATHDGGVLCSEAVVCIRAAELRATDSFMGELKLEIPHLYETGNILRNPLRKSPSAKDLKLWRVQPHHS